MSFWLAIPAAIIFTAFALTWECVHFLGERVGLLERALNTMVSRADFDAAKLAAATALNDLKRRVDADLQALRDELAAGNPVTDQDLADVQALTLNANAIDPAPPVA